MPINANELSPGDILFKHAERKLIPRIIKMKQRKILRGLTGGAGADTPIGQAAVARTHVAMAAGPSDVLEFDEGGNGAKIVFRSGYGFVRGDMKAGARKGKIYDVYTSSDPIVGKQAADNATLLWDITKGHGSRAKGQYGFAKLVQQAVAPKRGRSFTQADFEAKLQSWIEKASRGGRVKFFCSEFVTYCYLWAASQNEKFASIDQLLRTSQAKISPVELYWRVETCGHFKFKGRLYA